MLPTTLAEDAVSPLRTVYRDMLRAIAWTLASQWGIRGIGLLSTVIMARLLKPSDFGIVAMATIVMGLLDNFSRIGIAMLVIRDRDDSRDFYDTAWTAQLLQGIAIAVMLVVVAPLASIYFSEPRVVPVMQILALTALAGGVVNIGMVLVRKELNFATDFRFQIYHRLALLAVTIALAIVWRSYWAIVIGQFVGELVRIALSFGMHSYRPRLSVARLKSFLTFAKSVIPYNVGFFLSGKTDVFVVGRIAGAASLGVYNVAAELTSIFTREVVGTLGRGLLPNYAKLAGARDRLTEVFLTVLGATSGLAVAFGLGLAAVAPEFVKVVLGEQWVSAGPILRWLALYGTFVCILEAMSGHILVVVGEERLSATLIWCRLALLVPMTIAGAILGEPTAVAVAAAFSAALALPLVGYFLARTLSIGSTQLVAALWRPWVAGGAMLGATSFVSPWFENALPALIAKVVIGAAVYLGALIGLWYMVGKPDGPEKLAMEHLSATRRSTPRAEDQEG